MLLSETSRAVSGDMRSKTLSLTTFREGYLRKGRRERISIFISFMLTEHS